MGAYPGYYGKYDICSLASHTPLMQKVRGGVARETTIFVNCKAE